MAQLLQLRSDESVFPKSAFGIVNPFSDLGSAISEFIQERQKMNEQERIKSNLGALLDPENFASYGQGAVNLAQSMRGNLEATPRGRPVDPMTSALAPLLIKTQFDRPTAMETAAERIERLARGKYYSAAADEKTALSKRAGLGRAMAVSIDPNTNEEVPYGTPGSITQMKVIDEKGGVTYKNVPSNDRITPVQEMKLEEGIRKPGLMNWGKQNVDSGNAKRLSLILQGQPQDVVNRQLDLRVQLNEISPEAKDLTMKMLGFTPGQASGRGTVSAPPPQKGVSDFSSMSDEELRAIAEGR